MKAIKKILCVIMLTILVEGCGIGNIENNTEFKMNKEAFIDNYQITCTDYSIINDYNDESGIFLKVNYIVTNNSNKKVTIKIKDDFKFFLEDNNLLSSVSNEEIYFDENVTNKIEVVFNITEYDLKEPYKVLFYSNVASNNIAFILE